MKKTLLILFAFTTTNFLQSQPYIDTEFRTRFLIDDGYSSPSGIDDNTICFITQRSRLNAGYNGQELDAYISLQDVRLWGDDNNFKKSGTYGNTESISIHQAWFLLKPTNHISLKVGRQLFSYDDQRIISSRNWNDYQVSYDAVMLQLKDSLNKLDIALSWNSESSANNLFNADKFRTIDFIRYERLLNSVTLSTIMAVTGKTISDTSDIITLKGTYGLNFQYSKNNANIRASAYYQSGLNVHGPSIDAYCLSVFGSKIISASNTSAGLGIDYLSGEEGSLSVADYDNNRHTFDILYGRRHAYYGYMDYFSNLPTQGLIDIYIRLGQRLTKATKLELDYHYFRLAANAYHPENENEKMNNNLGNELDLTFKWKFMKIVELQSGYSLYNTTSTLKVLKQQESESVRFPQFFYVIITVKPRLL
ncbi:MAG: alginate export family protein [Bacteroidales bacterium]|nr:alginate export family protein [Bacteroidales bacterium]